MSTRVAVIAGGYSSESDVSLKSMQTIVNHLDKSIYEVYKVIITQNSWLCEVNGKNIPINKEDFTVTVDNNRLTFDFAYITIHGTPGEDGKLQAYFDMLSIPYNTASYIATTIAYNKWACNTILRANNIPVADSIVLRKKDKIDEDTILSKIGLPCFVKPNDGGSSFGISKVKEKEKLANAIKTAFAEGSEIMIEAPLVGTEITCGVYYTHGSIKTLPITEIVAENEFFDYEAKYEGKSKEYTPARITDDAAKKVKETAMSVYTILGLSGIVRIDMIIQNDTPFVIEVNITPGMSPASIIPQQVQIAGLSLTAFYSDIIKEKIEK